MPFTTLPTLVFFIFIGVSYEASPSVNSVFSSSSFFRLRSCEKWAVRVPESLRRFTDDIDWFYLHSAVIDMVSHQFHKKSDSKNCLYFSILFVFESLVPNIDFLMSCCCMLLCEIEWCRKKSFIKSFKVNICHKRSYTEMTYEQEIGTKQTRILNFSFSYYDFLVLEKIFFWLSLDRNLMFSSA